jgi:hypothetical protein
LHHSQQSGSFPVSLLHFELSSATLGATKIDASEIPHSVCSLLPTWVEGRVNSNLVDNAAAGNLHHPTSSFSFFGGQSTLGTYSNLVACGSSAFNMDSLKAGLETIHTISCKHVDIRGRVNQLKGKVEHWEKELNQIKLTFAIDTPIQKRKLIS